MNNQAPSPGASTGDLALRVVDLVAGYGAQPVLERVSLSMPLGEWLALLGPNGSGKSTLLYCIAGMLRPSAGQIEIFGCNLSRDAQKAKHSLGFTCAPERLPGLLTGRQCLEVYAAAKGVREIDTDVVGLIETFKMSAHLDRFVDTYSLGTRQKLSVLLALIGSPRLVVLDEAFNGLDPASARSLKQHVRRLVDTRRASVLLATHALDIVERYADRAALMLAGSIVKVWSAANVIAFRATGGLEEAIAETARESSQSE